MGWLRRPKDVFHVLDLSISEDSLKNKSINKTESNNMNYELGLN